MKSAIFFPGQGSQKPGMGKALAEHFEVAKRTFEEADEALGFSISTLCFEGPGDDLNLTFNSQPAILATSIAALRACEHVHGPVQADLAAGHSLGEWSALVAVGALDFADALRLVHLRGQAMQAAVPVGVGAMAAILKLSIEDVQAICEAAREGEVCSAANFNGGNQIVISGSKAAVERAMAATKEKKGKAIPLKVSAPFHCELMAPAAEKVAEALETIKIGDMRIPVVANADAAPNQDSSRVKELLIQQVTGAVRWQESVEYIASQGVSDAFEFGHGSVIKGLVRRIASDMTVVPIGQPDDIGAPNPNE
ncbi:MAG: ACP S-malonyltransferase [Kofleriaceae bacterium]|nr:ACP S-malonyltransferase [Kofleriaceae bacterium]